MQARRPRRAPIIARATVPNPPASWTGRERESEWLRRHVEAPGVIALGGWAGVGKTALVRSVLHREARARMVAASGSAASIRRAALEALLDAEVRVDPTDAALLAAADAARAILVLDGVDDRSLEELAPTLQYVADFATACTVVVTSRARAPADVGASVLWLEPMERVELEVLARALDPFASAETIGVALAAARTPRELVGQLADARHHAGRVHPALEGLPEAARGLAAILVATRSALPLGALEAAGVPIEAARALASRRIAAIEHDRVELRVEAREELAADPGCAHVPQGAALALAGALGAGASADAIEGARLALAVDRADVAASVLAPWLGGELGFADVAALWTLLQRRAEPELARARLVAAAQRGDVAALALLERPEALDARVSWAHLLLLSGRFDDAAAEACELERAARETDPALLFAAQSTRAHALLYQQRTTEARGLLARMVPVRDDQAILRDVLTADAASLAGEHPLARRLAVANVGRAMSSRETITTALTLARSGDVLRAEGILDALAPDLLGRPFDHPRGNYLLLLRAQIAIERGHVGTARAVFTCVEAAYRPGHVVDASIEIMRVRVALQDGRLDGARARLSSVAQTLALRPRTPNAHNALAATAELLAVVTAGGERLGLDVEVPDDDRSLWAETYRALAAIRAARTGAPPAAAPCVRGEHPATDAWCRIAAATLALTDELAGGALGFAIEASELARSAGLDGLAAEALVVAGEAAAIAGDEHGLRVASVGLEQLAEATGSSRLRGEASFFRAVRQRSPAAALAAPDLHRALPASRRSAALAGLDVRLDAIDVRVVDAIRARLGAGLAPAPPAVRATEHDGAWVIDADARSVWRADGEEIVLASQPVLFAILLGLARAGGAASAAELAARTWEIAEYHPLRDANRLRVAVRRLRDRIGADAIETVGDGYRLVGAVRILERGPEPLRA